MLTTCKHGLYYGALNQSWLQQKTGKVITSDDPAGCVHERLYNQLSGAFWKETMSYSNTGYHMM